MFNIEDENFGFPGDIGHLIKAMKCTKFCKQTQPYNVQFVKKLYVHMIDTSSKKAEVKLRGVKVSYS